MVHEEPNHDQFRRSSRTNNTFGGAAGTALIIRSRTPVTFSRPIAATAFTKNISMYPRIRSQM